MLKPPTIASSFKLLYIEIDIVTCLCINEKKTHLFVFQMFDMFINLLYGKMIIILTRVRYSVLAKEEGKLGVCFSQNALEAGYWPIAFN